MKRQTAYYVNQHLPPRQPHAIQAAGISIFSEDDGDHVSIQLHLSDGQIFGFATLKHEHLAELAAAIVRHYLEEAGDDLSTTAPLGRA